MAKIVKCNSDDYAALTEIWERSVRATHGFLTEDDIMEIKQSLGSAYFPNVELYAVEDGGIPAGFIGLSGGTIEMLFIDSDRRGLGYGTMLMDFAVCRGAVRVDVNEQNPSALAFYRAKGFRVVCRDATDEAGRPYPILHLALEVNGGQRGL